MKKDTLLHVVAEKFKDSIHKTLKIGKYNNLDEFGNRMDPKLRDLFINGPKKMSEVRTLFPAANN